MLQPITVEYVTYHGHPVIIASYIAGPDDIGATMGPEDVHLGDTVYLGFYQTHDLADMKSLFFPGDRMFSKTRENVFAEIDCYGFD